MNWSDERYVRVYTRDTADWLSLSFIAQGLLTLILRKVDRAGVMQLGRHGKRAVAITIGHSGDWSRLEPALEELLADGCVVIKGDYLIVPNFMEAQEAPMSDAQRQRDSREKRLAKSMAEELGVVTPVTSRDNSSQNVTAGHETGPNVTTGHTASQSVTPSVPSSLPSETTHTLPADARAEGEAARLAITADAPGRAPLADAVLKLLRTGGKNAMHASPEARASVEDAIASVTPETAAARIHLAWNPAKPWLTFYLEAITGKPSKPAGPKRGMATPSTDFTTPELNTL